MEKRYVGIKEISEYLGISINTAYAWRYRRKIPFTKMGKLVKFDLKKIEAWLEKNSVEACKKY
ncbi:MAG: helix-turn-helix domain-containing protein [Candidatus Omnitrophica bacterium]|nr:helix-turn-helix domain-containing protein [Candidatus Omnitrophota bacterium]MBU1810837.1 helix-turn-helix domain-containing protein [Candidatus Omnitrophota bacterium]